MEEEETAKVNRYDHVADEEDSEYHQLLLKLRVLLQGYNKALVQYSRVSAMPDPESYNMSSLRRWLMRDDGANGKARGTDGPDTTWGDLKDTGVPDSLRMHFRTVVVALFLSKPPPKVDLDLVVTYPKSNIDGLSKWIVYNLTPFYWSWQRKRDKSRREQQQKGQQAIEETSHRGEDISIPSRMEEGTQQKNRRTEEESEPADRHTFGTMSESTALRFTSGLSTVVACLTPVIAIAVLAQVEGMRNLLLCITGFAVMFAILLIFLTQGTTSRTEIFAATAA
ncbi:hypothetical protein N0V95_005409 [Ascochyta clinopodiicola]|nr:hypothetical protein N0V95_005409 [Ascochyta clinopodiicola]